MQRSILREPDFTVDAKSFFLFQSPLQHAQASIAGGLVASMMRIADQHCMTIVRVTQQLLMLARVELEREDGKRGGHRVFSGSSVRRGRSAEALSLTL